MTDMLKLLTALLLLATPMLAQAADSTPPHAVEFGFAHYGLSNGYSNWDSAYLDAEHRFGERHSAYGELQQARRYNLTDRELSGGYYHPLGEAWTAHIEASASPDHQFLPRNMLFGQMQYAFAEGWDIQAGLRRSQFNAASTDVTVLTGERYWGNFRAAYTLYLAKLQNAGTAPSHQLQLSYYYAENSSLSLSGSRGRQAENLGPGLGLLLLDVRNISLFGRHWLSQDWGLSYEAMSEHQGNLYSRKGIRLGLRYAF
jgi:YaiO family outer membrane protein